MNNELNLLAEADRRGILGGQQKVLFDEAVKRGLVTSDSPADVPVSPGAKHNKQSYDALSQNDTVQTPQTVPETNETYGAQIDAFRKKTKPAVLFIKGRNPPKRVPNGAKLANLPEGTLMYRDDATLDLATNGKLGEALGYGISEKPVSDSVITARDENGTAIQDVVTDGRPEVVEAAQRVAGEGGSVEERPAEDAIAERTGGKDIIEALRSTPVHSLMQLVMQSQGGASLPEMIKDAVVNTPESAVEFGKAIAQPVLHPKDTFEGIKSLVQGVYQKVTGAEEQPDAAAVDAIAQYYSERYGSVPGFKKAVAKDPIGVAADISLMLSGAGGAMGAAGKLGKIDALANTGKEISNIANTIEPLNVLKKSTVGIASKAIPEKLPAALYESGAKLSTRKTFTLKDRERAINTALEDGFLPKEGEISKIWTKVAENSDRVDSIIDQATNQNGTISRNKLLAEIPELAKQPHPQKGRRKAMLNKLSAELLDEYPEQIPVEQVQQMKRTIHKELANFYQNSAPKPAILNEFNAAVAKAAMHELEELYPELQSINKQTSDYLHLVKALEQSSKRVGNKNVVSLDTIIKGAAGYSVGDIGGLIGGLALGILDRDIVKTKLAVALHRARKGGVKTRSAVPKNIAHAAGTIKENSNN